MFIGAIDISYGSFSLVWLTKGRLPLPLAWLRPLFAPVLKRPLELVLEVAWSLELTETNLEDNLCSGFCTTSSFLFRVSALFLAVKLTFLCQLLLLLLLHPFLCLFVYLTLFGFYRILSNSSLTFFWCPLFPKIHAYMGEDFQLPHWCLQYPKILRSWIAFWYHWV